MKNMHFARAKINRAADLSLCVSLPIGRISLLFRNLKFKPLAIFLG